MAKGTTSVIREGSGTPTTGMPGGGRSAGFAGYPKGPKGAGGLGGAYQGKTATGAGTAARGGVPLRQTKTGRGK
jgi:hypothetical protein